MATDSADIIRSCRFFSHVKSPCFERLVAMSMVRTYLRGTAIFREGDPCPGVFIVASGLVRVFKLAANGKEHVLHMVGPGGTFAEVAAIGGFNCPAFADAIEDSQCLLLPAARFAAALREDHALCLQLMQSMALWVKHLVGLVEDISLRDALGRVARYLVETASQTDGSVRLPSLKRHLASHLNLTSETLSRTLRRLDDSGLIASDGESGIVVKDFEGLRRAAEGDSPVI